MKQFKESLNTAVITTKCIIDKELPIIYVFHFVDGSWQFSDGKENIPESDYRVISLNQIIELDASIINIADLQVGYTAYRRNILEPWEVFK